MTNLATLLLIVAVAAALFTGVRFRRIRRLSVQASLLIPSHDSLSWAPPMSKSSFKFESARIVELREAVVSAPWMSDLGQRASFADGVIQGASFIEAGLAVDPIVLTSLERWINHGNTFSGSGISDYLYQHHAAIFSAGSHDGFQHALSGYVGEQIAANELATSGHVVFLPDATNVPFWDMQVDGHLFQIKTGGTALSQAQASTDAHPDIGIISSPDVAAHFNHSIGLHDLSSDHLAEITSHSLSGLDTIASAGALHIPIITAIRSSWREITLLEKEATTLQIAAKNLSLDIAGTGLGAGGGAHAGAFVGSFLGPGIGTAIGAAFGALVGAVLGRLGTDHIKHASFRQANLDWLNSRMKCNADLQALTLQTQREIMTYVAARDAEVKATLSQERRHIHTMIAAERMHGMADVEETVAAFLIMLKQIEEDIWFGLSEFKVQQEFDKTRALIWPSVGDLAVSHARRWAKDAVGTIQLTRYRIAEAEKGKYRLPAFARMFLKRHAMTDRNVRLVKVMNEFFESYRFDSSEFLRGAENLVEDGFQRVLRIDEVIVAAKSRVEVLIGRVQREINATIDAAYIAFSNKAVEMREPTRKAQIKLRAEALKLGLK
jgi:hypothetical protein